MYCTGTLSTDGRGEKRPAGKKRNTPPRPARRTPSPTPARVRSMGQLLSQAAAHFAHEEPVVAALARVDGCYAIDGFDGGSFRPGWAENASRHPNHQQEHMQHCRCKTPEQLLGRFENECRLAIV